LKTRKFYAILADDIDQAATSELLAAVRKSSSSDKALWIVFAATPTAVAPHAAMVVAKPVSMELAMRTVRAAQGPIASEYRRYARHSLRTPVALTTPSKQEIQASLINISGGGLAVQLAAQQQLATATAISARFALPVSGEWVRVSGDVVWCDAEGRAGLRCKGVTPMDGERLRKWLAAQVVKGR
jgi:hypothetical protein